jgi:hypothetical protein
LHCAGSRLLSIHENMQLPGYLTLKRLLDTECEKPFGVTWLKKKVHTMSHLTEFLHGPTACRNLI